MIFSENTQKITSQDVILELSTFVDRLILSHLLTYVKK